MATYYASIPNFDVTAEIEASDTKHARTSFLDYLSRNGYIDWGQRKVTRKAIILKRVQPGEIPTSIQLDYDFDTGPVDEIELMGTEREPGEITDYGGAVEEPAEGYWESLEEAPEETTQGVSIPIISLSRQTGGL